MVGTVGFQITTLIISQRLYMIKLAKILIDLCLFRANPQDLPASYTFVFLTGILNVTATLAVLRLVTDYNIDQSLILSIALVVAFGLVIWVVLKSNNLVERWAQTITALFGTRTILLSIEWLLTPDTPQAETIAELVSNMGVYLIAVFIIDIWIIAITVLVLRHAIQTSIGISIIIGIFCEISHRLLVVLLLSPILSQ